MRAGFAVKDLPEAWRARMQSDLGIAPARRSRRLPAGRPLVRRLDRRRVPGLHHRQHPGGPAPRRRASPRTRRFPPRSAQGRFATLHAWLRDNVYRHGAKFAPAELVQRATGQPLRIEPYIAYLRTKYGGLYHLCKNSIRSRRDSADEMPTRPRAARPAGRRRRSTAASFHRPDRRARGQARRATRARPPCAPSNSCASH